MSEPRGISELGRAEVRALPLYAPDVGACAVDVSDNTNLWGAPPAALRVLRDASSTLLARYPSLYGEPLAPALLLYTGATTAGMAVVTGCGSDDVLDSTMRAFGAPGSTIAFCAPTFSMIPSLARLNGLVPVPIPFIGDFDIDADRLVDAGAAITYICSPNNPTATPVSRAAVEHVASRAQGIVVIDEAYAEFSPEQFVDLAARNDRVVIARTFSKAFGLAGLRVGYAVGAADAIRLIERARGPYKVSAVAESAAAAALSDAEGGLAWVQDHAARAMENRARLAAALVDLGLSALPSAANFVMVPTPRAVSIQRALVAHGVLVRAFTGMPRDMRALDESGGCALRIGVGPWEMMRVLLDALHEVLA